MTGYPRRETGRVTTPSSTYWLPPLDGQGEARGRGEGDTDLPESRGAAGSPGASSDDGGRDD